MPAKAASFSNCRICKDGRLVEENLTFSHETGLFVQSNGYISTDPIDLQGNVVAPGFIELQTNGMRGFHFTHFEDEGSYATKLDEVAQYLPSQGVTGLYVTIPTVASNEFKKVGSPKFNLFPMAHAAQVDPTILETTRSPFWSIHSGGSCRRPIPPSLQERRPQRLALLPTIHSSRRSVRSYRNLIRNPQTRHHRP